MSAGPGEGPRADVLGIASANMEHGGLDHGSDARWQRTMAALASWGPDVGCLQLWRAGSYAQHDGGGSDHLLFRVTVGAAELAATPAPGFRP